MCKIVEKFVEKLIPNVDCIMTNKEFRIEDVCANHKIIGLIILPFLN